MLTQRLIDHVEKDLGEDLSYLREIAHESPTGFWKLALQAPLLRHRGTVPATLLHLAGLGAVQVEDCGPCVQTAVNEARRRGVPATLLQAALAGGADLPPLERDAYNFGRMIAGEEMLDPELPQRLEAEVGRRGMVELSLPVAAVRIFPALKRGLGYARSCSLVQVNVQ